MNPRLQIAGKTGGDFAADPVLSPGALHKNPGTEYQHNQRNQDPNQYFLEFPQPQEFKDAKLVDRRLQTNKVPSLQMLR